MRALNFDYGQCMTQRHDVSDVPNLWPFKLHVLCMIRNEHYEFQVF